METVHERDLVTRLVELCVFNAAVVVVQRESQVAA